MSSKKSGMKTSQAKNKTKCRGGCVHGHGPPQPANQVATATIVKSETAPLTPSMPTALPNLIEAVVGQDEPLVKENIELKNQQKILEAKIHDMEAQQDKARLLNTRLDNLCTELQNRTKLLKEESEVKIQEAETRGKELAKEVSGNLGAMESISENLKEITQDSLQSKKFNQNLAQQIPQMKLEYAKKEEDTMAKIQETNDKIVKARMELAQTKLDNAHDKENTFAELKTLATAIIESREQMQTIKETEISLRKHVANYDEKFATLQEALVETNKAYDGFKGEMEKVTVQAKDLEAGSKKWHNLWEESNTELLQLQQTRDKLQKDLQKTTENLLKMTDLYTALKKEQSVVNMEATEAAVDKLMQKKGIAAPTKSESGQANKLTNNEVAVKQTCEVKQSQQDSKPQSQLNENVKPQEPIPALVSTSSNLVASETQPQQAPPKSPDQQSTNKNKKKRKGKNK